MSNRQGTARYLLLLLAMHTVSRTVERMQSILVLEHAPFAGLGEAREALTRACRVDTVRTHVGEEVPLSAEGYAGVVVLGGPQTAFLDEGFPTRSQELMLIEDTLSREIPYLGICLGAQLLALVAGGTGYRGEVSETGWCEITPTPAAREDLLLRGSSDPYPVLQSHSDHYTLPQSATLLGTGEVYPNQAFRVGDMAWGFQYHLEAGKDFINVRKDLLSFWEGKDHDGPDNEEDQVLFEKHRGDVLERYLRLVQTCTVPLQDCRREPTAGLPLDTAQHLR